MDTVKRRKMLFCVLNNILPVHEHYFEHIIVESVETQVS